VYVGQDLEASRDELPAPRGWIWRALTWIEPENNPSRVVYGVLVTGAVLAAESSVDETMFQAAASVAVTIVLLWVSHAYSYAVADRMATGKGWSSRTAVEAGVHEWPLIRGSLVPLVVLLLAGAAGASTTTALYVAMMSAVALLVLFELVAGLRSHLPTAALLVQTAIGGVLGIGIVVLKVVIHL
jgi:hypothetical protein